MNTRALRSLLIALAVVGLGTGAYGVAAPRSFYDVVLGVDALPPYNSHLLGDTGGLYLGFGVVFAWAARTMQRDLVRAACAAWLVVQGIHLAYHLAHLDGLGTGTAVAQTIGLTIGAALPAAGLVLQRRIDDG